MREAQIEAWEEHQQVIIPVSQRRERNMTPLEKFREYETE
jgi:hypothetical protein